MLPFESVVEQHGASVLRVVRATLEPADADDAWSETFLAALRVYPSLPEDANVEAWLVTIARRKAVDVHRARSRRAVPVAEPPETPAPPDFHDPDLIAAVDALLGGTPAAARRAAADGIATLRRTYSEEIALHD